MLFLAGEFLKDKNFLNQLLRRRAFKKKLRGLVGYRLALNSLIIEDDLELLTLLFVPPQS